MSANNHSASYRYAKEIIIYIHRDHCIKRSAQVYNFCVHRAAHAPIAKAKPQAGPMV